MNNYYPMLAKTGKDMNVVTQGDYALEEKLDGIRCLAYCTTNYHRLINRSGLDVTVRFPEVVLPKQDCVVDGELCCYNSSGYTDFQLIQTRMHRDLGIAKAAQAHPAKFVMFDTLEYAQLMIVSHPYSKRSVITQALANAHGVASPRRWPGEVLTQAWLDDICAKGMEGVIAKRSDSSYYPSLRSASWLKFKGTRVATFEVLGATYGEGKRSDVIGALLIGRTIDGVTQYLGRVGTGFDDLELGRLSRLLYGVSINERNYDHWKEWGSIVRGFPSSIGETTRYFVMPETLYCKVKYQELTSHGVPRFPVYAGLCEHE